jgi:hypothetical protein
MKLNDLFLYRKKKVHFHPDTLTDWAGDMHFAGFWAVHELRQ